MVRNVGRLAAAGLGALLLMAGGTCASELVYRPTNPSLGGDPLNGNWLLSQATAQNSESGGGAGSGGFSIDFPDFGGIPQTDPEPVELPDAESQSQSLTGAASTAPNGN